ncbi:hypothetical protein OGAPHI_001974 [Ogataea philodendri]|uniref:Uncharacterized protein n=1 Tax=Ogataea philodendri TaxID=1378263 RepID=A0A9P8PAK1_9ASCO|nr:uncharacterized protein OGAPHI_001974 [Ogataea philodendri]KAH3668220.1 hypothetical protein OGAPHI_001974 [Ogataea philodendri]
MTTVQAKQTPHLFPSTSSLNSQSSNQKSFTSLRLLLSSKSKSSTPTPASSRTELSQSSSLNTSVASETVNFSRKQTTRRRSNFPHTYESSTLESLYNPHLLRQKTLDYLRPKLNHLSPKQFEFLVADQIPLQLSPSYEKLWISPSMNKTNLQATPPYVPTSLNTTSLATFQFQYFNFLVRLQLNKLTRPL